MSKLNRFILFAVLCVGMASCSSGPGSVADATAIPGRTPGSSAQASVLSPTPTDEAPASPTPGLTMPIFTPPTPAPPAPVTLSQGGVQRIPVADAKGLVDSGVAQLYDVRAPSQYQSLHAAGALPFPETEMAARYPELPSDSWLIFY